MSKEKEGKRKLISNVTKLDEKIKTPTDAEFTKRDKGGLNINEFETITIGKRNYKLYQSFLLKPSERKNIKITHWHLVSTEDYYLHSEDMQATEKFFELDFSKHKTLLFQLAHPYYLTKDIPYLAECGCTHYFDLSILYQKWKDHCVFLDNIKSYVNLHFPNYSKSQDTGRKTMREASKLYPNTIIEDISNFLNNYQLNQIQQAKIDALKNSGLPNITEKIAKKLVEMYINQTK